MPQDRSARATGSAGNRINAVAAGAEWLRRHGHGATVVPHHDADGLAAGVLLARRTQGATIHVASPWEEPLPSHRPAVVVDWGVRPVRGPEEVLYVDHHAEPEMVDGTVVIPSGGGETSTSLVAWNLLDEPSAQGWLAALGAVGDLGQRVLSRKDVPSVGSGRELRRLASLVNAPGRLRDGSVDHAFTLLMDSESEREALAHPLHRELEQALETVNAARSRAIRTAPRLGAEAALLRFSEPARVHSLVASAWARRLAPRIVIAANDGWREGKVSFVVRSADDRDLRAWLRARHTPPPGSGDYARGHARATGGALTAEAFEDFVEAVLA